jgi:hypothetical protein
MKGDGKMMKNGKAVHPQIAPIYADLSCLGFDRRSDPANAAGTPESRCGFDWQDAVEELLMRQDCPEICRGKVESRKNYEEGRSLPGVAPRREVEWRFVRGRARAEVSVRPLSAGPTIARGEKAKK